jgi:hypothetical protein
VEFGNIATAILSKLDNNSNITVLSINITGNTAPANGWYLPSANTLACTTASTQRCTINSAGNVTINAPTSGTALTIAGGGLTVTAGGLTVSAGGAAIAGASSITAPGAGNFGLGVTATNNATVGVISMTASGTGDALLQAAANGNTLGSTDLYVGQLHDSRGAIINRANANLLLGSNNVTQIIITAGGGMQVGSPTGGDKGAGTINVATSYYVNGSLLVGEGWTNIIKGSTTSRTSTTTLAADPDFTFSHAASGTYEIELIMIGAMAVGGTGGMSMQFITSAASIAAPFTYGFYCISRGGSSYGMQTTSIGLSNISSAPVPNMDCHPVTGSSCYMKFLFQPNASGTLALWWAQNLSDTNATQLLAGSVLRYRKIA